MAKNPKGLFLIPPVTSMAKQMPGVRFGGGTIFKLAADGQYSVLFNFQFPLNIGSPFLLDGSLPDPQLVLDQHGDIFGATQAGGLDNLGTIFKLRPNGTETVLYAFTKGADPNIPYPNGILPDQGVLRDSNGNFFGITSFGGNPVGADGGACAFALSDVFHSGCGTIFKLDPSTGEQTILHEFNFSDGSDPWQNLFQDSAGNIYGVAQHGGIGNCNQGCGVLFKLSSTGEFTVLHRFKGGNNPPPFGATSNTASTTPPDGQFPTAVTVDPATGIVYGSTFEGGTSNIGIIFKIDKHGTYTILHNFAGPEGAFGASLIPHNGKLYGASGGGALKLCPAQRAVGPQGGCGVLFQLDLATNEYKVLHIFHGRGDGEDVGFLIMDSAGDLLGTTLDGGIVGDPDVCAKRGCGTIFKFTPQ